MGRYDYQWAPYVSVAERRNKAAKLIEKERQKGRIYHPIEIEGRAIAKTFWGKAWCKNLEAYSDFESRLPRGRTYTRNGSIIDFQVSKGRIEALVMGSSLYKVAIAVQPMPQNRWKDLAEACAGKIDSLIELLQGKFSQHVMEILTETDSGLFPKVSEIDLHCSCPDYADMCKHSAAVLYGMGASLDHHPEWLFLLRHVDHLDLIGAVDTSQALLQQPQQIQEEDLSALFGIDIGKSSPPPKEPTKKTAKAHTKKKPLPEEETFLFIVEDDKPRKPRKRSS